MLCLILLFLYSSVFLLHYLTRVSIRWWQKVLIGMIDGVGCMERDMQDLLNPPTHTFHLSLSLSHPFFHSLHLKHSHWVLGPFFAPSGSGWNWRDYVAVHMCAWSGALLLKSVRSGIKLLQQCLGQSGPQCSECACMHFSKAMVLEWVLCVTPSVYYNFCLSTRGPGINQRTSLILCLHLITELKRLITFFYTCIASFVCSPSFSVAHLCNLEGNWLHMAAKKNYFIKFHYLMQWHSHMFKCFSVGHNIIYFKECE